MDKLRALKYFIEVAENQSFSLSASTFNVPASSISRRISDLESSLGAQLLTRSTRSVVLTEIGREYLSQAKLIVDQLHHADEMVKSYQSKPAGVLKISCLNGFGEQVLLPILDEFEEIYPEVTLDITLTDQLSKLERDDVDIAIRGGFAPNERVIATRLMDNNFILASSPEYLSTHGTPKRPEDLRQHQGLFYNTPIGPTPWLIQHKHKVIDVSGRPLLTVNNGKYLIQKALQGKGIVSLPRWELQTYFDSGDLTELTFKPPVKVSLNRDLGIFLLYQKLKYSVPKIKVAVDFIARRVRENFPEQ